MIPLEDLIAWYWRYGTERAARYELRADDWLDRLYTCRATDEAVAFGRAQTKPAMALWGPRQTGKSTLISRYVEEEDDPSGRDSALTWPGGTSVRFVKARGSSDPPPGTVVLNPFNFGSDGSGCLSRFRLATDVLDSKHPIEIRLASPTQLRHALALGYVGECRTDLDDGQTVHLDLPSLEERIKVLEVKPKGSAALSALEAFEEIHRLADLLGDLALTNLPRYTNLGAKYADARRKILRAAVAKPDREAVSSLANDLLWDSRPALNRFYDRLISWLGRHAATWGTRTIYCSPAVAAALLDFESVNTLAKGPGQPLYALVSSIRVDVQADRIVIGTEAGSPLFPDVGDFAVFQGIVLELVIPIRRKAAARHELFVRFLEEADLLDFPGVSPKGANIQALLDLEQPGIEKELFTAVLKRGKTASIVASYARRLTIDGFSILTRLGRAPDKTEQLATGILTWWRAYEPDARESRKSRSPLPLNLVLTYGAHLIQLADSSGVNEKVGAVIAMLGDLGDLADPKVVHHTLATNYPQFPEGRLPDDPRRAVDLARKIMEVPEFRAQFDSDLGPESFLKMVEDGGTDLLLKTLRDQAGRSPRAAKLDQRDRSNREDLVRLLDESQPSQDDPGPSRRRALQVWVAKLEADMSASTASDPAGDCSARLRRMLDVDPEVLDPIPNYLGQLPRDAPKLLQYVDAQIQNWWKHAEGLIQNDCEGLGFRDPKHLREVLLALADHVDRRAIADWLQNTLGRVATRQDANHHRRYLALRIANALMPGPQSRPHRDSSLIASELGYFEERQRERPAAGEGYRASPHYHHFLNPYLQYLRGLAETPRAEERPPQPGDAELLEIIVRIRAALGGIPR